MNQPEEERPCLLQPAGFDAVATHARLNEKYYAHPSK
jgi:hypothetical protein